MEKEHSAGPPGGRRIQQRCPRLRHQGVRRGMTMPICQNCGTHVTERYAAVFTSDDVTESRVCPHCVDMTRDGTGLREKKT